MTIPQDTLDHLVRGYLDAVARNLVGLPEERRRELLADLADHIAAERATLDEPTEADIRAILDRLGDPAAVAAEARLQEGPPVWPSARPMSAARPWQSCQRTAGLPSARALDTGPAPSHRFLDGSRLRR